jgi:hypothetical protein
LTILATLFIKHTSSKPTLPSTPSRALEAVQSMSESQKSAWEDMFKKKEAHLAAQRKFRTSELLRYEERDQKFAATKSTMEDASSPGPHRFWLTIDIVKKSTAKERTLNRTIRANQRARRPSLEAYRAAKKTAAHSQLRRLSDCDQDVMTAFDQWWEAAS